MGYDLTAIPRKQFQDLKLNGSHVQFASVERDCQLIGIDTQAARHENRFARSFAARPPCRGVPYRRAEAREQFRGAKGLRDVIVRATVERGDFIPLPHARGHDYDGDIAPLAEGAQGIEPIDIGKAQIKDNDVGTMRRDERGNLEPASGRYDAVSVRVQYGREKMAYRALVLDYQDEPFTFHPVPLTREVRQT
jgi:hypothetical protein